MYPDPCAKRTAIKLTRRTLLTGLSALTTLAAIRHSEAVGAMDPTLDVANLVNRTHPLAHNLGWWWLTLPQLHGGAADWVDLMRHRRGVPTGMSATMSATSGYSKYTTRPGGGGHVSFDGTDDYISVADNDMFTFNVGGQDQPFSLMGWFWFTDITLAAGFITKSGDAGAGEEWLFRNGGASNLSFLIGNPTESAFIALDVTMTTALYQAQWVHLAATYTGSETAGGLTLYRNGVSVGGTPNTTGSYTGMTNGTRAVLLGALSGPTQFLNGKLDDLRIYTEAVTPAKVRAIFLNSRGGSPGLLNRLPLAAYRSPTSLAARNKARVF